MSSKITIEFIDDAEAAQMAMNAPHLYQALRETNEMLRRIDKYADLSNDQAELLGTIRDKFNEILTDKGITL